jgi:hypothetical protein
LRGWTATKVRAIASNGRRTADKVIIIEKVTRAAEDKIKRRHSLHDRALAAYDFPNRLKTGQNRSPVPPSML